MTEPDRDRRDRPGRRFSLNFNVRILFQGRPPTQWEKDRPLVRIVILGILGVLAIVGTILIRTQT